MTNMCRHTVGIVGFLMYQDAVIVVVPSASHTYAEMGHRKTFAQAERYICDSRMCEIKLYTTADSHESAIDQDRHRQSRTGVQHCHCVNMAIASVAEWHAYDHSIGVCYWCLIYIQPIQGVLPAGSMIHVFAAEDTETPAVIADVKFIKTLRGAIGKGPDFELIKIVQLI